MVKEVTFRLTNKLMYTLISLSMIILLTLGVYAYGTSNPSSFGHSAGEIDFSEGGFDTDVYFNENVYVTNQISVEGNADFGGVLYIKDGKVGIGTADPAQKLDIVEDFDGQTRLRISNTNAGGSAHAGVWLKSDGGDFYLYRTSNAYTPASSTLQDDVVFQEAGGGDFVFYLGAERVRIRNNGNMEVSGSVKASSFCIGSSCVTSWPYTSCNWNGWASDSYVQVTSSPVSCTILCEGTNALRFQKQCSGGRLVAESICNC